LKKLKLNSPNSLESQMKGITAALPCPSCPWCSIDEKVNGLFVRLSSWCSSHNRELNITDNGRIINTRLVLTLSYSAINWSCVSIIAYYGYVYRVNCGWCDATMSCSRLFVKGRYLETKEYDRNMNQIIWLRGSTPHYVVWGGRNGRGWGWIGSLQQQSPSPTIDKSRVDVIISELMFVVGVIYRMVF
jgi:hypothetical protein